LLAELADEARQRAKWRELTTEEHDVAMAALRDLAAGRADLAAPGGRPGGGLSCAGTAGPIWNS